jgi:hypothetical protein
VQDAHGSSVCHIRLYASVIVHVLKDSCIPSMRQPTAVTCTATRLVEAIFSRLLSSRRLTNIHRHALDCLIQLERPLLPGTASNTVINAQGLACRAQGRSGLFEVLLTDYLQLGPRCQGN